MRRVHIKFLEIMQLQREIQNAFTLVQFIYFTLSVQSNYMAKNMWINEMIPGNHFLSGGEPSFICIHAHTQAMRACLYVSNEL